MLRSYVRERLSDGQRHNQFGEAPVGYIGYAPEGRMYAIFTRDDRVAPRDARGLRVHLRQVNQV